MPGTVGNTRATPGQRVAPAATRALRASGRDALFLFSEMDTNGDGVLQLHELRAGFERIFGSESVELRDIEDMFAQLDLLFEQLVLRLLLILWRVCFSCFKYK